jgi:dolichyl-phosphate-mannose--protein O-mannosyl transferase
VLYTVDEWLPDYLNLWTIKEGHNAERCKLGDPITCGMTVRLEHTLSRKNLQSNLDYKSSLSQRQEVSTFGYNGDGTSDDDWIIECTADEPVYTDVTIHLKHKNTGSYLAAENKDYVFNDNNCRGFCPIKGDREVHGARNKKNGSFQIKGVYI